MLGAIALFARASPQTTRCPLDGLHIFRWRIALACVRAAISRGRGCRNLYFCTSKRTAIIRHVFGPSSQRVVYPATLSSLSSNKAVLVGEVDNVIRLFTGPTVLTTEHLANAFRQFISMVIIETVKIEKTAMTSQLVSEYLTHGILTQYPPV
jgi:hypothetical protein